MKSVLNYKNSVYFDFHRQLFNENEYSTLLEELTEKVLPKMENMKNGDKINFTENRSVEHISLRANATDSWYKKEVQEVMDDIESFVQEVHSGNLLSSTGKKFKNIISIGIGGSYLGLEYFYKSIENEKKMNLRLLSNIDPRNLIDCLEDIDPEETMVIIISKTFTTQETIINAECVKDWLVSNIHGVDSEVIVQKHMIAVSTNLEKVTSFGISKTFGFWDWVGGRYSVWSAVGMLPIGLTFGFDVVNQILNGARDADIHFFNEPIENNIPIHMGLITIDHIQRGFSCRAILPYSQALERFPAHIQQVEMESNGKHIDFHGNKVEKSGQVVFGEPGTNGQHSFYQYLHQGTQIIPCEFIGFCKQKKGVYTKHGSSISNHDELMCNFFAQPDALFYGKNEKVLRTEGCDETLIPHKVFQGGRPSTLLLMDDLSSYNLGFLLAIYEHYVAVQGFYFDINSFDQWGVELGKELAQNVKKTMNGDSSIELNKSTQNILNFYLKTKSS
jgi:glucose-6-phosphate isomerase